MSVVSTVTCETYDDEAVRRALKGVLAPLGGLERFVEPGMRVLLKPNLLAATPPEEAVTTHPAVVRAVAEMVQAAGGRVMIGDSSAGPVEHAPEVWRATGLAQAAEGMGLSMTPFEGVTWKRLDGRDYLIARPVFEADLVINLPKLKTHLFTRYTGAVKNLFGTIPGTRKRELHYQAPGVTEFSRLLVDLLALIRPGLTIMDGVLGMEGNGPGIGGTPRAYDCLLASPDPVALDAVVAAALGYRTGEVVHLAQAHRRGLGMGARDRIRVAGEKRALDFGAVDLPRSRWFFRVPAWLTEPLQGLLKVRPRLQAGATCIECGRCAEVCPKDAITLGQSPCFDLEQCIGCFCCAEVCPQGAIEPQRNWLAKLIGAGR
jgi:uncharacterized protein (DUF362 family)/Pyruvate/2-oxoacid:ferredoxin oxidoreductase delta subunit